MMNKTPYGSLCLLLILVILSCTTTGCQPGGKIATTATAAGEHPPTPTIPAPQTPTVVMPVASPTSIPLLPTSEAIAGIEPYFAAYQEPIASTVPVMYHEPIAHNLSNVLVSFMLSETQRARLAQDGFVVNPGTELEFFTIYERARYENVPVFVTSDSLLHSYHLLFGKVLRTAETKAFRRRLRMLNQAMLVQTDIQYQALQGTACEEAARRTVAFVSVGSKLLDPNTTVPAYVEELVEEELALIEAASGVSPSPIMRGATVDYTQFIPRGHYTTSERLTAYFKNMMWYGRVTFRLAPDEPDVGRMETRSALLLVNALRTASAGEQSALKLWMDIYYPTAFLVGSSDSLTVLQYAELMDEVYGIGISAQDLTDESLLDTFIEEALQLPPSRIMSVINPDTGALEEPNKGLQFMGQRFVPDTYIFRQLLYLNVGTEEKPRMLPKGLDIMAAFGSERAYVLLEEMGETAYANYPEQMAAMRDWVSGFGMEDWTGTLYNTWLYAFQPLLAEPGDGYPAFMQSEAWLDKQLNTSLGSWTELRHDTILYAMPALSETGGAPFVPSIVLAQGYVEPVPEFYARLAALTAMTREGMGQRGLLTEQDDDSLRRLESLALALKLFAEKELRGEPLTEGQHELIRFYGIELEKLVLASLDEPISAGWIEGDTQAALVVDVASADATSLTLEEATGRIHLIYVVVPLIKPDGSIMLEVAQGGVFSYYEFTWPTSDRLTDEAWQAMLDAGEAPDLPKWTDSFLTTETENYTLRETIRNFQKRVAMGYWYLDENELDPAGEGVKAQFAAIFQEMREADQVIHHKWVSTNHRSYDFQSETLVVVTVRETWLDDLHQVTVMDEEWGHHTSEIIAHRGPYTLDVTYTLEYVEEEGDHYWKIVRVVYANQPPAWQPVSE